MYFRSSIRRNPATGQIDSYCRLVESYRNERDRVCHRTLLNVGFLTGLITVDELNQVRRIICKRYQDISGTRFLRKVSVIPTFAKSAANGFAIKHWSSWNYLIFCQIQVFSEEETRLAITQIIARAIYPASELETARWIRENSALCSVTGYPIEKITKDKLYKSALKVFSEKEKQNGFFP